MLKPDYPLTTERLTIRPYQQDDYEAAFAYWSREDVTRYLYLSAYTRENFQERLDEVMSRTALTAEGDVLTLAIVPHDVGHPVGDVTLFWISEQHRAGEIGFVLHPDHQGHGFAHEASMALLGLGFDELSLHRIQGRLDGRNAASAAVLSRLGLRREAHLVENEWIKGEWTDEMVYAMLRREWRAR